MKTILIVDDTFENLYLLKVILEQANYTVIEAKDGKEGLDKLNKNRVDLIISDILMPVMDGYMFCRACKNNKLFKDIPFVFYTSTYIEDSDEDFALNLGAVKFLIKPIDPTELVLAIENIFLEHKEQLKPTKPKKFTEEEVLKLYSKRLIGKLEQKTLHLENEVIEREKTEQLLIKKNEILDLFTVNTPLNKIFDQLLLNFESVHPDYYGSISLVDDSGSHLILESAPSLPKPYALSINNLPILDNSGSCPTAAFTKSPVIVSDISKEKSWDEYKDIALEHGLKSCWSVPILSKDNTVLGTFAIYSKSVRLPSLDEIREVNFAVSLANIALEKSRIVSEIKKKDESYKALIDQASDAILTYSLDGTIHEFNKATYQILGYTFEEFSEFKIQDIIIGDFITQPDTYERIVNGESVFFERQFRSKNNVVVDMEISAKRQKDDKILSIGRNITERKKAELKLQESEFHLKQSQIVANIGSYNVDLRTMTWESTLMLDEILGIDETYEKTVENWSNRIHPDERQEALDHFEDCMQTNKKFNQEYRVVKLNTNEEIWVHGIGEIILDSDCKPIKLIGTIQDITHRKHSEIILKESQKSLLIAQELAKIGSFDLKIESLVGDTSITFKTIIGVDSDTVVDFDLWKTIVHPDDRSLIKNNVFESLNRKQIFNLEYRIITKNDKQLKWIHGIGETVYSDGKATNFVGTIQDITARKKIELDLEIANKFSLSLLKSMHEGLVAINLESEIISVNPSFCKMTGFTENELIGVKRPYPFSPPEMREANNERYKLLVQNKNKKDYENTYMRKNGERFPVHVLLSSIYDENGVRTANFATIEDITERKKAEVNLQLSKAFNDKLVMAMQEGLIIVDPKGEITLVNDSFCTILGYSREELLGLNLPYPFAKIEDLDKILEFNKKIAEGDGESFQFEFIRKNGEKFLASFLAGNIKDDNGEVIALFGTMKDVSKAERAKAILKYNAKKSLERKNVIIELASLVGTDYKEALNKITELSAKTLHIERGSILKFNKAKTEMLCEKLYIKAIDSYESGQVFYRKENEKYFNELIHNNIVAASDVYSHDIYDGFVEDHFRPLNIKSKLSIPIQGIDEVYGILCFEQVGNEHIWSTEEEEFATSIANLVSLMIQSAERKLAEVSSLLANNQLTIANNKLNNLRNQLEQENVYLRNELDLVFNYEDMVYGSAEFSNVLTELEKVAPTKATVLLLGESGTGKELLARAVHNISTRNKKPLIKVNCAAIPRELLESELFGHKKGSFTGAFNDKIGKFELADNGTLFLDEIGELPLDMQPKILRFLQEGEIEVVGGAGTKKLDVRVIAATNRNLKEEIDKKRFREDLYFRLNVFPINVPALRERKDDIPLLVEHFVDKFNKNYGKNIKYIAEEAMVKLKNYDWPGNIRELENLIERASILSIDETLVIPGFESSGQTINPINNKDLSLDIVQREHILMVLEQCNWKISGPSGAAKLLNIKPSTLRDRMKKLDLKKPE